MRVHTLSFSRQAMLVPFLFVGIVAGYFVGTLVEQTFAPWLCAIYGLGVADMTVRWFVARRSVRVPEQQS